jgi:hypothetical protein
LVSFFTYRQLSFLLTVIRLQHLLMSVKIMIIQFQPHLAQTVIELKRGQVGFDAVGDVNRGLFLTRAAQGQFFRQTAPMGRPGIALVTPMGFVVILFFYTSP